MVSLSGVKFSSPVARSCLIVLSILLLIDAVLLIYAAIVYPHLIDIHNDILYIENSSAVTRIYAIVASVAIFVSISTGAAAYKCESYYVLIHAGITGIFVPVSILVFFTTSSERYKIKDFILDLDFMIKDFRIGHINTEGHNGKLCSFINSIDSIQSKFKCCGVNATKDWAVLGCGGFIPSSCCHEEDSFTKKDYEWAKKFNVDNEHVFTVCQQEKVHVKGCLDELVEDERAKHDWLANLIIFMALCTLANAIVSMLLFGFNKTQEDEYDGKIELSILGASSKPRPSQPAITSITRRPSIFPSFNQTPSMSPPLEPINEKIKARAQAVKFRLSDSPRPSFSGQSKFSPAARRGSSFT